MYMYIVDCIL